MARQAQASCPARGEETASAAVQSVSNLPPEDGSTMARQSRQWSERRTASIGFPVLGQLGVRSTSIEGQRLIGVRAM